MELRTQQEPLSRDQADSQSNPELSQSFEDRY